MSADEYVIVRASDGKCLASLQKTFGMREYVESWAGTPDTAGRTFRFPSHAAAMTCVIAYAQDGWDPEPIDIRRVADATTTEVVSASAAKKGLGATHPSLLVDLAMLLTGASAEIVLHPPVESSAGTRYSATITDYFEESETFNSTDLGDLFAQLFKWGQKPWQGVSWPHASDEEAYVDPSGESPSILKAMRESGRARQL